MIEVWTSYRSYFDSSINLSEAALNFLVDPIHQHITAAHTSSTSHSYWPESHHSRSCKFGATDRPDSKSSLGSLQHRHHPNRCPQYRFASFSTGYSWADRTALNNWLVIPLGWRIQHKADQSRHRRLQIAFSCSFLFSSTIRQRLELQKTA